MCGVASFFLLRLFLDSLFGLFGAKATKATSLGILF